MAEFIIEEKPVGESASTGRNASLEVPYTVQVTDESDDATTLEARDALKDFVDDERDDLKLVGVRVDEIAPGRGWDGTATYGPEGSGSAAFPPGEFRFSFNTGGNTQHITQSRSTINKYAPDGETAPDQKGAIGVNGDSVDGVDIIAPIYEFEETHTLTNGQVTDAYKGTLFALTGRMNLGTFRGLNPGECLFLGASGSRRDASFWDVTFRFAGSPNRSDFTVGDITVGTKLGWDYMWVLYEEDGSGTSLVKKPKAVYIERVYEPGDFSLLGI